MIDLNNLPKKIKNAFNLRQKSIEEITQLQVELLKKHISHALKGEFYSKLLGKNFDVSDITSIEDIKKLPLTDRKSLEENTNSFFAVKKEKFCDLNLTSGTTSNPVLIPYTKKDLDRLAFNEAIAFAGFGTTANDCFLLCVTLDKCFVAGLAYFLGLKMLGAKIIRSGPGQIHRQWELIKKLKPTGIVGVPSFLIKMAKWAQDNNIDPKNFGIKHLVAIGEPIRNIDLTSNNLGKEIKKLWGIDAISTYAATELETCFCECYKAQGCHIHPELSIVEIIDETTNNPVPEGVCGEVVVTPLGVEGLPLIRYKTGDIARLYTSKCDCLWTTPRLGPIEGRLSQRLKYKGTTLYPDMIFQILTEIPEIEASYIEVRESYKLSDEITVIVSSKEHKIDINKVKKLLQAKLRVTPIIKAEKFETVMKKIQPPGQRKPKRFFDLRRKYE